MMVVLVDLPLTVVDDRVGLAVAVLCVLVAGKRGLDVYEGLLVGERALTLTLTFVLVSQPVLTTSTYVVAWPQSDQFLGGGM